MATAKKDIPETTAAPETVADYSDGATLVRKLSPKTVMEGKIVPRDSDGNVVAANLYTVIGVAHATKTGNSDNGPFCAFLGSFEASRAKDGKVFQSGQCFVPKAVEDLLVSAMRAGQKDDAHASVEFAIEVGIKPSDTAIGYEYTVKNLVKTQNADPLAALRGKLLTLPAPAGK